MNSRLRRSLTRYLVTLATAASMGLADPSTDLLRVPTDLVLDLLDDVDDALPDAVRKNVLTLLTSDPRPAVRGRVIDTIRLHQIDQGRLVALLRRLARDPSPEVRAATSDALVECLDTLPALNRVDLISRLVLSRSELERATVASALGSRIPILGVEAAIEHLAADGAATVRQAAIQAASQRFEENPAAYRDIARLHVADTDRRSRRLARKVLRRVA